MDSSRPVLWHIRISHYSEKVRWALDHKSVDYEARAPLPGMHMPVALWLTRGRGFTLPVLELDGRRIGDSTAIIAALERRYPDPPLYPADAGERRRALGLEDWFDKNVGPYVRRLAFHEAARDRERMTAVADRITPGMSKRFGRLTAPMTSGFAALRYRSGSSSAAEDARSHVLAALDRLETELGDGEYLVGEDFTVADLTAAALMSPFVLPPEGPLEAGLMPDAYQRWRAEHSGRRGFRWVQEIFARHRRAGAGTTLAGHAGAGAA
jgi:glutathione S-transferase